MYLMELGLVSFIQVAWIFATLPVAVACFPLPGLAWFRSALLGIAKRGKILQSKSKLTVPQRFFFHFYVVGVLWTTILLISVWSYAMREHEQQHVWLSVFLLLLMEVQVLRRFYESIYVFNYSPSARMHILGYLVGIFFYALAPLSLCCNFAPQVFDFVNGSKVRMLWAGSENIWVFVIPFLRLPWYAWIGGVVFLWGWVHQRRCHQILGSLRNKSEKVEYIIPYGDWFEYVSSPHYTAEIVLYGGLVVASGGVDLSLWLLFAFVVANLVFAAMETQIWYRQKFEDYPRNRCVIFPFVY